MTRTRVVSPEPNPLQAVRARTVSALLPDVDLLLDRIDSSLIAHAGGARGNALFDAVRGRTRLQAEVEPLELRPRSAVPPPDVETVGSSWPSARTAHLDRCLAELQRWLGASLADVCAAAGLNRGTVYAWRGRGSQPRPGTVAGVLRLHGLVSSAVHAAGEDGATQWFHAGTPSPLERLARSNGDASVTAGVSRELRRAITGPVLPPPNPLLAVTVDDSPARPLA